MLSSKGRIFNELGNSDVFVWACKRRSKSAAGGGAE